MVFILPGLIALGSGVRAAAAPYTPLQATDYPGPVETNIVATTDEQGYPGVNTPVATASVSLTPTLTETATSTLPVNVFQTENAQMGNSQVTPQVTETPGPTITPYRSPTPTLTTPTPAPVVSAKKTGGLKMDWGLFWIGFALPVVAACGLVLYLIDRRPDFFNPSLRK